jgi:ATPase subunit of ABC transporter with duplicated ATPase domains
MEGLQLEAGRDSIGIRAREQIHNLIQVSQYFHIKTAQRNVLGLLAFPEMRARTDIVEAAHRDTFKWIFDEGNCRQTPKPRITQERAGISDEKNRERIESFVTWLSSGTGMYLIAGKMGSGKSTLMKYLSGHNRVREELQKWAGKGRAWPGSIRFIFTRHG